MIKDVIITIVGEQCIDNDSDSIELITDGKFGFKDDSFFISYDDSKLSDTKSVSKTVLYVKPDDSVVMQRNGDFSTRMVIQKGVKNTCLYSTGQGNLTLSIFGESIKHNLDSSGGKISLSYTIYAQSRVLSRNKVNISIREV